MSNVIELLKDDSNYYGAIGRQYLSNSDIGILLSNPKEFGKPKEDNINFSKGRLFHQSILEPDKAKDFVHVDTNVRSTKVYKQFLIDNDVPFAMLRKEYHEILESVDTMIAHWDFFSMIRKDGAIYEQPAVKEIHGRMWKGKADIVTDTHVYDLKTTSNIHDFKWSARKYNYDSQAFIYETLFGKRMEFLVIDKPSGLLGHFTASDEFLSRGEEKVRRAIEIHDKFFIDNPVEDIDDYYIKDVL